MDQVCAYCSQPATAEGYFTTTPPLCAKHLDLAIMIGFMAGRNMEINVGTVTTLLAQCRANNGQLSLEEADIPALLPAMLANPVHA